jgi:hypothetical protein
MSSVWRCNLSQTSSRAKVKLRSEDYELTSSRAKVKLRSEDYELIASVTGFRVLGLVIIFCW